MSEPVPGVLAEAISAPPSLIHVAGDLVVNLTKQERADTAFDAFLKTAIAYGSQKKTARPDAAAPAIIVRDDAAPWKIMADGHQVDAREAVTDHVALLFPDTGWTIAVNALAQGNGKPHKTQQDVEAAAKQLQLLDADDWGLASDKVYERHVIDRRFWQPTLDKNLYPSLPTNDWYWTSTAVPGSSASAFHVLLDLGLVSNLDRDYSGFGLACRRPRQ